MKLPLLQRLFSPPRPPNAQQRRQHLNAGQWPAVIYAIGDVHGCSTLLSALLALIQEDAQGVEGERWLVMLGDYIDRGPDSAGVLDMILAPPMQGFRRFCLAGNHETMLLAFLDNPAAGEQWLHYGGYETLASYGLALNAARAMPPSVLARELQRRMPEEHLALLRELPLTLALPDTVFVHAGIRRGIALSEQVEGDLLWIRGDFLDADPAGGPLVVHGHTPGQEPVVAPGRICVDTGAYATERLTAVRLEPGAPPRFLATGHKH